MSLETSILAPQYALPISKDLLHNSTSAKFFDWQEILLHKLGDDIRHFVRRSVPAPDDRDERKHWQQRRALAREIVRLSLSDAWGLILEWGLEHGEDDPFVIMETARTVVLPEEKYLINDLMDIKRGDHLTMKGYIGHLLYCRTKLKEMDLEVPDDVILWRIMDDMRANYPDSALDWSDKMENGELHFADFIGDLGQKDFDETRFQKNGGGCPRCRQGHSVTWVWCTRCSRCHPGGEAGCTTEIVRIVPV